MRTVPAAVVAAAIGALLAVSSAVVLVNVVAGPSPEEVAEQRSSEPVDAEDLAYGTN